MVKLNQEQAEAIGKILLRLHENDHIDPESIKINNQMDTTTIAVEWTESWLEPNGANWHDKATVWYKHTAFIYSTGAVKAIREPAEDQS